MVNSALLVATG